MFSSGAASIARQFSASRKISSKDVWFAEEAYCLLEFPEWVCLLSQSDPKLEPDADVYYAGLLAGMVGELPSDTIRPLYIRFFQDRMLGPDDERRGHHTLNILQLIAGRLPAIEGLSLDHFRLRDIAFLGAFTKLKALSIAGCREVFDFAPLSNLGALEVLRLDGSRISDLSPLVKLPNLRVVSLAGCSLVTDESIRVLAESHAKGALASLQSLRLNGTGVAGVGKDILAKGSPISIFSFIRPAHPEARATD